MFYSHLRSAGVAQLVEHLIRNEGVVGSSPITGTRNKNRPKRGVFFILFLWLPWHVALLGIIMYSDHLPTDLQS